MANIAQIIRADVANGPGLRVSVFLSGCRIRCKNCFQPQVWAFDYGAPADDALIRSVIEDVSQPHYQGLSILGGEPFEPENQDLLLDLVQRVRNACPDKNIWVYTGTTLENLLDSLDPRHTPITEAILRNIDVLVDGPFVQEEHDIALLYRGSRNQRLIDMRRFWETGDIRLWGESNG